MNDESTTFPGVSLVGPGRAGTTIALGLMACGYRMVGVAGRSVDAPSTLQTAAILDAHARFVSDVGIGADIVIIATPDHAISGVANAIAATVEPGALVMHLAGSHTLAVFDELVALRPDVRVASLHPLQTFPSASVGVDRLPGAYAAIEGDAQIEQIAADLEVVAMRINPTDRVRYHAAAVVASNHLVALLGQVERLAASVGVPFEAFGALIDASVDNTFALGAARALTGPVARGDLKTVEAHLRALDPSERDAYRSLAREAARLAQHRSDGLDRLLNDLESYE